MSRTIGPVVVPFYGEQAGVHNLRGRMRQIGGQVVDADWSGVRSLSQILIDPAPQAAEGWDISTAVFSQSFSVAAKETNPQDVFFRPDGLKMYVVGNGSNRVNEYSLSTAWNVGSASFAQFFGIVSQDSLPSGVFFRPDGEKMYVIGNQSDSVHEYTLGTAWDVSSAAFSQTFSVSAQETAPSGVFFKPDGTKMYVVGNNGDAVNEYNLSSAWDVGTASYSQNFSVASQATFPTGVFFKPDGTRMYVVDVTGVDVNEYSLSAAWDVATASYVRNISVSAKESTPLGVFFKNDGLKMYVTGNASDSIHEYDLTPA